ncbi:hypothetical protein TPA0906_05640 [Streptomyces olivaceus]|nr:hypothetical protein TPA0906_05640 [Streptomyces olivaceus]
MLALEALGEPAQEVLRGAVLHQPHGDGAPATAVVLRHQAAAACQGGGHTDKGEEATSHEGSFCLTDGQGAERTGMDVLRTRKETRQGGTSPEQLVRVSGILVCTNEKVKG